MAAAFEAVCAGLGLRYERDDPATRLVAETVVALARSGVRDLDQMKAMALEKFTSSSTL